MLNIVQKMPQRALHSSFGQLDDLVVSEHPELPPLEAFLASLAMANGKSHFHFEDDVELCDMFADRAMAAVQLFPDRLITFFTMERVRGVVTNADGFGFNGSLAVYVPAWLAESVPESLAAFRKKFPNSQEGDRLMAFHLRQLNEPYVIWYPCLAQHLVGPSLMDPRRPQDRQTKYFVRNNA